jgi:peptidoglycan-associated lipoprotein
MVALFRRTTRFVLVIPFAASLVAGCKATPQPAVASSATPALPVAAPVPSSASALATMNALIYFENDQANISDSAKAILEEKVAIFRANPDMRIVILGYASEPGTKDYNFALGGRRAAAAQDYLVGRGIKLDRIEIVTRGKGELVVEGPGEVAAAQNRRDEFKLLIGSGYLVQPSASKRY